MIPHQLVTLTSEGIDMGQLYYVNYIHQGYPLTRFFKNKKEANAYSYLKHLDGAKYHYLCVDLVAYPAADDTYNILVNGEFTISGDVGGA